MVSLIVATTENGVIGKDGKMPWLLPADLKHFKEITTSGECNSIIMGRKTFESIGKRLPDRENVVITRERDKKKTDKIDAHVFNTIQNAIDHIRGWEYFIKKEHQVFIIGGAQIYEEAIRMNSVDKIYHTLIHTNIAGDTFFKIPSEWKVVSESFNSADEKNSYDYTFRILTKGQDL